MPDPKICPRCYRYPTACVCEPGREVATVEAAPLPDDRDELWRLIAILEKVLERLKRQAGRGGDRG